jgi:hypothetical protein
MIKRIKKLQNHYKALFAITIGFSVIAFWRGTWLLLDLYLFPNSQIKSAIASITIGLGILLITHYTTRELE